MQTLISILLTLLIFTVIVLVHEWGHFRMARHHGVTVEEFAVGMGPKLCSKTSKKGTEYSLRAFPIGGFCRMTGEEEAVDEPGSFSTKSVGARISIVAAGPIMNFVLAMVLLIAITMGYGYITRTVAAVESGSPAQEAGMQVGDEIVKVDGKSIHIFSKVSYVLSSYDGEGAVEVVVRRADGTQETLTMTPRYDEELQRYRFGFSAASTGGGLRTMIAEEGWSRLPSILWGILKQSFWTFCYEVEMTISGFVQLVTGAVGLNAVSGPIGVVSVVGSVYEESVSYGFLSVLSSLVSLTVLLSANLGVLNLFPIPALDGSRIVFLILEKIRRKPLNEKVEGWIYTIGFLLLIGFMIVVAFNDILKLF
jgi:regulator of sigma E protease